MAIIITIEEVMVATVATLGTEAVDEGTCMVEPGIITLHIIGVLMTEVFHVAAPDHLEAIPAQDLEHQIAEEVVVTGVAVVLIVLNTVGPICHHVLEVGAGHLKKRRRGSQGK